jgi:hypothetical protein
LGQKQVHRPNGGTVHINYATPFDQK